MKPTLEEYANSVVGGTVVDELAGLAEHIRDRSLHNFSTAGGRGSEVLTRMIPLLRELGIRVHWDVIKCDDDFLRVERALHKALEGSPVEITEEMFELYSETASMNLREVDLRGDICLVHDLGPAGMVLGKELTNGKHWIWRCHLDLSSPELRAWSRMKPVFESYDSVVFSMPEFSRRLSVPQYLIPPSIDPLSDRNRDIPPDYVERVLDKYGIDPEKPILAQYSKFREQKDPMGVIRAYRLVQKKRTDCQLLLMGPKPFDDPDELEVWRQVQEAADGDKNLHVLSMPPLSDLELNALTRGATVVIQKSTREGYGMAVSEAQWKRKPVVGGAAGVVNSQVIDGVTGYLVHSPEGAANRTFELLANPELRTSMGDNGHEYVEQNFLITRHVRDYLLLMLTAKYPGQDIVSLA